MLMPLVSVQNTQCGRRNGIAAIPSHPAFKTRATTRVIYSRDKKKSPKGQPEDNGKAR
jgi:hypothetical protein